MRMWKNYHKYRIILHKCQQFLCPVPLFNLHRTLCTTVCIACSTSIYVQLTFFFFQKRNLELSYFSLPQLLHPSAPHLLADLGISFRFVGFWCGLRVLTENNCRRIKRVKGSSTFCCSGMPRIVKTGDCLWLS